MAESNLLRQIARKNSSKERIASKVIRNPKLLPQLFDGLESANARTRYGCNTILRIISEEEPKLLYPSFDFFARLLEGDSTIFRWSAIRVLANLAAVDSEKRTEKILGRYLAPVTGPALIPAANTIKGAARIAAAKPELADRIAAALVKTEKGSYETDECRNIALGHAISAFERFFKGLRNRAGVLALVKRQLDNPRRATSRKAAAFLKRHAGSR